MWLKEDCTTYQWELLINIINFIKLVMESYNWPLSLAKVNFTIRLWTTDITNIQSARMEYYNIQDTVSSTADEGDTFTHTDFTENGTQDSMLDSPSHEFNLSDFEHPPVRFDVHIDTSPTLSEDNIEMEELRPLTGMLPVVCCPAATIFSIYICTCSVIMIIIYMYHVECISSK